MVATVVLRADHRAVVEGLTHVHHLHALWTTMVVDLTWVVHVLCRHRLVTIGRWQGELGHWMVLFVSVHHKFLRKLCGLVI